MFNDIWALVVEDDAHSLVAIAAIFKELGIQHKRNTTGAGVIPQLKTMQPQPHFILLDLDLPGGDSFAICRAIRASAALRHIPVVAIGDKGWARQQPQLQAAGFAGFISKPLPRSRFGGLMRHVLMGSAVWPT